MAQQMLKVAVISTAFALVAQACASGGGGDGPASEALAAMQPAGPSAAAPAGVSGPMPVGTAPAPGSAPGSGVSPSGPAAGGTASTPPGSGGLTPPPAMGGGTMAAPGSGNGAAPAVGGNTPPSNIDPPGTTAPGDPSGATPPDPSIVPPSMSGMEGIDWMTAPMATGAADPPPEEGSCCPDGDCLCRNPDPSSPSVFKIRGPFKFEVHPGQTGNIYYPVDATAPFAGVAVCGGFTNTGLEMQDWGPFYASWGIVTAITWTGALDQPATRGRALLASIRELKQLNEQSGSPLSGKMAGRYGISGYSMGGGGTTMGCRDDPSLKTGIGLAPWSPVTGMRVPTLFLCGDIDFVAGVTNPRTATGTPSMQVVFGLYSHFEWFWPDERTGYYALAWQKTYLEGDTRWEPLLSEMLPGVASMRR